MNKGDAEQLVIIRDQLADLKQSLYESTDPSLERTSDNFSSLIKQITDIQENILFGQYLDYSLKQFEKYANAKPTSQKNFKKEK